MSEAVVNLLPERPEASKCILTSSSQPVWSPFLSKRSKTSSLEDENICRVQEAVVRLQTAGPPARPSAAPTFAVYSSGEGE